MSNSTALAVSDVKKLIARNREQLLTKVPKGVDADTLLTKALMCIGDNPDLLGCTPVSLFTAIRDSVVSGLPIGGVRPLAYVIPYGRTATLQLDYRGWIELVRRTGKLAKVVVDVVREGDQFEIVKGLEDRIVHIPSKAPTKGRDVTHVYAGFKLTNGETVIECWDIEQIQDHKEKYSKSWRKADSPWQTNWIAMAKKTVLLQPIYRGLVPVSETIEDQLQRERIIEAGKYDPESNDVLSGVEPAWLPEAKTVEPAEKPKQSSKKKTQQASKGEQPKSKSEPKETPEPSDNWPDVYKALQDELATASRPVAVKSIEDKFSELASSDEERFEVQSACKSRVDEIAGQEATT